MVNLAEAALKTQDLAMHQKNYPENLFQTELR